MPYQTLFRCELRRIRNIIDGIAAFGIEVRTGENAIGKLAGVLEILDNEEEERQDEREEQIPHEAALVVMQSTVDGECDRQRRPEQYQGVEATHLPVEKGARVQKDLRVP